jgi:hypothetical protein
MFYGYSNDFGALEGIFMKNLWKIIMTAFNFIWKNKENEKMGKSLNYVF